MKGDLASNYNSEEGRGLPRTTPPLEANAAKPSWLVLTDKEGSTASESADGDSFDACELGGYQTQWVRRDLQNLVLQQRSRIGLLPRRLPRVGDSSTKTEHRGDQHPKGMFTTHALFAWKTLLTQTTLHYEEGKGTPCGVTHGRHNSSLRVHCFSSSSSERAPLGDRQDQPVVDLLAR